jgi:hypothetical protein
VLLQQLPHAKDAGYTAGNRQKCLRGTRQDILEEIYAWALNPNNKRVYWLSGSAGTGKSTICQSFAEYCFAHGLLGASFFCSRDFSDRSSLSLIFPTLALDLAYKYPAFREALLEIIRATPNVGNQSLSLQLDNLLIRPLKSSKISTIIVIDALDECKDDSPASAILSMLGKHIDSLDSVKIFVTGRPEPPISLGFRLPLMRPHTEVFQLHNMKAGSVDHDIQLYVETQMRDLVMIRSDVEFPTPWPGEGAIATIVRKADGLFIFASTTCKFVAYPHGEPPDLLRQVLEAADSSNFEGPLGLDSLYTRILSDNYSGTHSLVNVVGRLKPVLGSIVVVANPLSSSALGQLLGLQGSEVRTALRFLHSLIHVPEPHDEPIRVYHKSFADYLVDKERCLEPKLRVDPGDHHAHLAVRCLEVMNGSLKRNPCDIPRYAMNEDVEDLQERRKTHIGPVLEYACTFWTQHLLQAARSTETITKTLGLMETFMDQHFLSWLEVLSVAGTVRTAVYSFRDAKTWLNQVCLSFSSYLCYSHEHRSTLAMMGLLNPLKTERDSFLASSTSSWYRHAIYTNLLLTWHPSAQSFADHSSTSRRKLDLGML